MADNAEWNGAVSKAKTRKGSLSSDVLAQHKANVTNCIGKAHQKESQELVAAAATQLVTMLSAFLFYECNDKRAGHSFFEKQQAELSELDELVEPLVHMSRKTRPKESEDGRSLHDVAIATKAMFETIVLATVYCPAWKVRWLKSIVTLVCGELRNCSYFCMLAIKRGHEIDMEVRLIEELMFLLGGKVDCFRQDQGSYLEWSWRFERSGNPVVYLNQWKSVDKVVPGTATARPEGSVAYALELMPSAKYCQNLNRAAVVSCPLTGPDGDPIYDRFNEKLIESIDACIEWANTQ